MEPLDHYYIRDSIGTGGFGDVYLGIHKETGLAVAIKVINLALSEDPNFKAAVEREIDILCKLEHPCIYKFFDFIRTDEKYYLIFEYLDNGKILDFVNDHGRLLDKTARHFFTQLMSALSYVHEKKSVAHRDIKAENVLLDRYFNFRLIDFGLSTCFDSHFHVMRTICGCTIYASPEMVKGNPYFPSTDIWSAGVLLYTVCSGHFPFYDESKSIPNIIEKILNSEPDYPNYFDENLVDLLKNMFIKDPIKRISINQILQHPWVTKESLPIEFDSITDCMFNINKTIKNSMKNRTESDTEPIPTVQSLLDQELVEFIRDNYNMDTSLIKTDFDYQPNSTIRIRPNNETVTYMILKRLKDTDSLSKFYSSPYDHLPGGSCFSVIASSKQNECNQDIFSKHQNLKPNPNVPIRKRTLRPSGGPT